MTITIERMESPERGAPSVFLRDEHAYPQPSAIVGGATFTETLTKRVSAMTAVLAVAFGTMDYAVERPRPEPIQNVSWVVQPSPESHVDNAAERYERLRSEIVASGTPLLSDDELRAEIESRRGARDF